jgi:hypothetical protein
MLSPQTTVTAYARLNGRITRMTINYGEKMPYGVSLLQQLRHIQQKLMFAPTTNCFASNVRKKRRNYKID